jgi:tRNA A37 threonylcarbamoyladenosine dehydratase
LNEFSRTELLLGKDAVNRLKSSSVAVFGVGGVGSYTVEALARSGVGEFALFDNDKVCITNINRQLIATHKTIGRQKVDVMKERILEINPEAKVEVFNCFYCLENANEFDLSKYSYIVDAIDSVSSKLVLIQEARKNNVPIISSMGAGNKLDPTMFEVSDIFKTSVCPLARVMRKELKARDIGDLKVVYSKEPPLSPNKSENTEVTQKRQTPGSVSFVPSVVGLIIAGEVIKDIVAKMYVI